MEFKLSSNDVDRRVKHLKRELNSLTKSKLYRAENKIEDGASNVVEAVKNGGKYFMKKLSG